MIKAKTIFDAYPDSDLLSLLPPSDDATVGEYLKTCDADFGDTLFLFILKELNDDCEDADDAFRRINNAIEQLTAVRDALST